MTSRPVTELQRLSAAARRGTSRGGVPGPAPTDSSATGSSATPLGRSLALVGRDSPEATLLARAALAGLHLQAGRTPSLPTAPAPQFVSVERPAPAIPAALARLLPTLAQQPEVLRETLTLLYPTGRRLNAVQARPLLALSTGDRDPLSALLWPVLNEHARWLARLHPVWRRHDPALLSPSAQLASLRWELVETRAASTDPLAIEAVAADLLARWPTFRADERRVALGAVASRPHLADLPLLHLAMNDRLPDLRRQARVLQGQLPGEVQDAVRAALPTWFGLEKGKLTLLRGEYVPALGEVDVTTTADNELGRLLGAFPLAELPGLLKADLVEVRAAVLASPAHLGSPAHTSRGRNVLEDLHHAARAGADLNTLIALGPGLDPLLVFWPQRRIRSLLLEVTARLIGRAELDGTLMRTAVTVLEALTEPLPAAEVGPEGASPEQPRSGMLARVADALGGRPQKTPVGQLAQTDWPTHLHALAERLLSALSREVSSHALPLETLLTALHIHLDPACPDPDAPDPKPPPDLPEHPSRQQQEAQTVALILYSQQIRARSNLTHILGLRRQVRAALVSEA